jgi:F-type H+-transporting ATPase subunit b
MDALANIGVDWKLLLAQVVNFGILLFILKRYAYQPMLRLMDERTMKIERGLSDAAAAAKKLQDVAQEETAILAAARTDAKKILAETDEAAKKRDAMRVVETENRVKKLLADAEVKIAEDRLKMLAEAKGELAETVVLAVERILKEKSEK